MILLEEVPDTGMLVLVIQFNGYKDNYQNDSRIKLDRLPKSIKADDLGIRIMPVSFGLVKTVIEGVSRATGVMQMYTYSDLTPDKYLHLYDALIKFCTSLEWWGSWEVMIAQGVIRED